MSEQCVECERLLERIELLEKELASARLSVEWFAAYERAYHDLQSIGDYRISFWKRMNEFLHFFHLPRMWAIYRWGAAIRAMEHFYEIEQRQMSAKARKHYLIRDKV